MFLRGEKAKGDKLSPHNAAELIKIHGLKAGELEINIGKVKTKVLSELANFLTIGESLLFFPKKKQLS